MSKLRGRQLLIGIDPGLRDTGLVFVGTDGPGLPVLHNRHTATWRDESIDAQRDVERADRMLEAVWSWIRLVERAAADDGRVVDAIVMERFDHRPWLRTSNGDPRRVATSPEMGRLIGRLIERCHALGAAQLIEVAPGVSKAGWPNKETQRRNFLPGALRNRHERDAYLAASAGAAILTHRTRTQETTR